MSRAANDGVRAGFAEAHAEVRRGLVPDKTFAADLTHHLFRAF
jgi:hypothetical protein